jgi:hypothetical protein
MPKNLSLSDWKYIIQSLVKPIPGTIQPGLIFEILLLFIKSKIFQLSVTGTFIYICQQAGLVSNKFLKATHQRHLVYRKQFFRPFSPFLAIWQSFFRNRAAQQHRIAENSAVVSPPDNPVGQPSYEKEPVVNPRRIFGKWKPHPTEPSFTFFTCLSRAICHVVIIPLDVYITRTIVQGYVARGLTLSSGLPPIILPSFNPWIGQPFVQWTSEFGLAVLYDSLFCFFTHLI